MKTYTLSLCVLLSATLIDALKFPVRQVKSRSTTTRKRSGHAAVSRPVLAAASTPDDIGLR